MSIKAVVRIGSVAIVGGAFLALWGCGVVDHSDKSKVAAASGPLPASEPGKTILAADSPKLSQIHTELVQTSMVPIGSVSAPGKVEANPNRLSHVVLPLTGHVTSVLVKIGGVKKIDAQFDGTMNDFLIPGIIFR